MRTRSPDKQYKDIKLPEDLNALWYEAFGTEFPSDLSVLDLASELIMEFKEFAEDLFHDFVMDERFAHETELPDAMHQLWYTFFGEKPPKGISVADAADVFSRYLHNRARLILQAYLVRKFTYLEKISPKNLYLIWLEEFGQEAPPFTKQELIRSLRCYFGLPSRNPWIREYEQQFAELNQLPPKKLHEKWKSLFKEEPPADSDTVIMSKLAVYLGDQSYNSKQRMLN